MAAIPILFDQTVHIYSTMDGTPIRRKNYSFLQVSGVKQYQMKCFVQEHISLPSTGKEAIKSTEI